MSTDTVEDATIIKETAVSQNSTVKFLNDLGDAFYEAADNVKNKTRQAVNSPIVQSIGTTAILMSETMLVTYAILLGMRMGNRLSERTADAILPSKPQPPLGK